MNNGIKGRVQLLSISKHLHAIHNDQPLMRWKVGLFQNRLHVTAKTKYLGILNQIQSDCRQAAREDDLRKRNDVQFQILIDFAGALKLLADMSSANNNIGTTAILDAANIQKTIASEVSKPKRK